MQKTDLLLHRLDEIGESLSTRSSALALLGLGSVGIDLDRLDQFSDLDFFVIVQSGSKAAYLKNLDWLTAIAPAAYYFANTGDGYKFLYEDGIFCEFAVFGEDEIKTAVYSPGRIIWKADGVEETISIPKPINHEQQKPTAWLIGEALTNLYVGMSRERRGETLSATRFIQSYAVDHVLVLSERLKIAQTDNRDAFGVERRYEQRYPDMALILPSFLQGYAKNRESALAILSFLDQHIEINLAMKQEIIKLCKLNG